MENLDLIKELAAEIECESKNKHTLLPMDNLSRYSLSHRHKYDHLLIRLEQEQYRESIKFAISNFDSIYMSCQLPNKLELSDEKLGLLGSMLIENGFISPDTNIDEFIWIFGGKVKPISILNRYTPFELMEITNILHCPDSVVIRKEQPIVWIKSMSTTKGEITNKKSLLDLFKLLGFSFKQYRDKNLISELFVTADGSSLIYSPQNYKEFEKTDCKSEYHNILVKIVEKCSM